MNYIKGELSGVWIIEPRRITDSRGYFCETFRADEFRRIVGPVDFVQENESESVHGVIRGLHYQAGAASQAKLVSVCSGSIVDVAVDLRRSSPTFGRSMLIKLDSDSGCRLYIPRGFAHGFAVLSERARFQYKVDNYYCPLSERTDRLAAVSRRNDLIRQRPQRYPFLLCRTFRLNVNKKLRSGIFRNGA